MDPVANFLTSIRNAYMVRNEHALTPASKLTLRLAKLLTKEGYLADVAEETTDAGRKMLKLTMRYTDKQPAVLSIRRVSKPGRRLYAGADRLPRPKTGFGTLVISSSAGLMTDREARQKKVGGEIVAEIIRGANR